MPDFNPKDMDALFREGAERHEFEYNPDAWALMEDKLDKKESKRRILFYLLGLAFLLGTVIAYSYYNINQLNEKEAIIASEIIDPKDVQEEVLTIEEGKLDNVLENKLNSNTQIDNTQEEVTQEKQEEYITIDSKESSSNIGAQNSFQSENTGNLIGNEIVSIDSQNGSVQDESKAVNDNITYQNVELSSHNSNEQFNKQEKKDILSIPTLSNTQFAILDNVRNELASFDLTPTKTQITPISLTSNNRFALTVFANPEWSSVGLFKQSKAGWSAGVRFGYQFADKFEISAGLAFSRKIYNGTGTEYTMEGGWFNDKEPVRMDAKCDVIEIPVGLTYYANGFRNSGFFADLGINSYMLHSEWYGFDYNDALVRPERYVDVVAEDENKHLVGVGRLAIGYQKILSNKTSLQVAPYLQFPLTGIGAGQVNLYSSGVQIAVKFNTQ